MRAENLFRHSTTARFARGPETCRFSTYLLLQLVKVRHYPIRQCLREAGLAGCVEEIGHVGLQSISSSWSSSIAYRSTWPGYAFQPTNWIFVGPRKSSSLGSMPGVTHHGNTTPCCVRYSSNSRERSATKMRGTNRDIDSGKHGFVDLAGAAHQVRVRPSKRSVVEPFSIFGRQSGFNTPSMSRKRTCKEILPESENADP